MTEYSYETHDYDVVVVGARFLNFDQVWHIQDFTDFAEIFTNTFLAEMRLRHALSFLFLCLAEVSLGVNTPLVIGH